MIDAWSRKVVGWSMRDDLRSELVVDALGMALIRRQPKRGLVHHSDRGSQIHEPRVRQDDAGGGGAAEHGPPR